MSFRSIIKQYSWCPEILYFILGVKKQGYFLKQLSQGFNSSFTEQYFHSPTLPLFRYLTHLLSTHCVVSILLEIGDETGNDTLHDLPF